MTFGGSHPEEDKDQSTEGEQAKTDVSVLWDLLGSNLMSRGVTGAAGAGKKNSQSFSLS